MAEETSHPTKKHIRFSPLATDIDGGTFDASSGGGGGGGRGRGKFAKKSKKKGLVALLEKLNVWEWATFGLLTFATVLFFIAFLTNGWGTIVVHESSSSKNGYNATKGEFWEFGLWQTCRNDHFCLVTRWPPFFIATRTFCTLALIGQLVSLTWFIGHSLEKILLYDICAYSCLISFIWFTGICLLIAISCFGAKWGVEFEEEFHGTRVYLNYAYYFTLVSCLLTFASGGTLLKHTILTRDYFRTLKENNLTAEELLGKDEEGNVRYV